MENRFTIKDFFLFALLIGTIAMVGLSMKQYDRQWRQVQELGGKNDALTRDINHLRDLVQNIVSRPPPNITIHNVVPGGAGGAGGAAPTTQQASAAANLPTNAPANGSGGQPVVTVTEAATDPAKSQNPFARLIAAREKPDFAQGDWYIENLPTRIGRLTPLVNEDVYGSTVRARVGETLLTRDPDTLEFKPLLAESYEVSPDGLTFTFKLRRGV